jgi:hypothetical protein
MKEIKVSNESHSPSLMPTITLEDALKRTIQDTYSKTFIMAIIRLGSEPDRIDWIAQLIHGQDGSFIMMEENIMSCGDFHNVLHGRTIREVIDYLLDRYPWSEFYLIENWHDMQKLLNDRLGR